MHTFISIGKSPKFNIQNKLQMTIQIPSNFYICTTSTSLEFIQRALLIYCFYKRVMEQVDDFYFSALADSDQDLFPISDEKYADELQLQEVLISSAVAAFNRYGLPIKKIKTEPVAMQPTRIKTEPGESSSTTKSDTFCKICMEHPPTSSMFFSINCSHSFCRNCISRYIATKINDNVLALKCPEDNCNGLLEPQQCQEIVPKEVFERWGSALCESMILGSNNFSYCPFKDCSALLTVDEGEGSLGQSECPSCCRLFCMKCKAAWHNGLSCEEFEKLGVEDLKLIEIAKSKKWMRCPQCKFYVEKTQGCLHVTCRCRYEFCYGCGKKWADTHASCGSN